MKGHLGTHAFHFGDVHEALGEDGFGDGAGVGDDAGEGAELGLHVGGETGVGMGGEGEAFGVGVGVDGDAVLGDLHFETAVGEGGGDGAEVFGDDLFEGDAVADHGACDEEGAGFDAVGDDGVFGAVEFFDAFDGDAVGACAFDFGAHFDEEVGEVFDFGFGGGAFDDGGAFGEGGGHHDVVGAKHGGAVFAHEVEGAAFEVGAGGRDEDIAAFDLDGGAEGFEATEVEVDRAVTNDAAAGEGDAGFAEAAGEGAEDADGGTHFAHQIVGGFGFDFVGGDDDDAAGAFDFGTEFTEDADHVVGIAEVGDTADGAGILGKQGGGEDGEGGVFGAADGDAAF